MNRMSILKHMLLSFRFLSRSRLIYRGSFLFYVRSKRFFKTDINGRSGNFVLHVVSDGGTYEDFLMVTPREFDKYEVGDPFGKRGVVARSNRDFVIRTSKSLEEQAAITEVSKASLMLGLTSCAGLIIAIIGLIISALFVIHFLYAIFT